MPQAMHLVWLHCFWDYKQAAPGGCLKKRALILSIISWIDSQSTRSKNPQYIPVFCGCCCSIALKLDVSVIYYALHRRMLPTASWGNTDTVSATGQELWTILGFVDDYAGKGNILIFPASSQWNTMPTSLLRTSEIVPPYFWTFLSNIESFSLKLDGKKRVNFWSGTQRSHLPFPCTDFRVKIE